MVMVCMLVPSDFALILGKRVDAKQVFLRDEGG